MIPTPGKLWTGPVRWVTMSWVVWVVALADLSGSLAGYTYWYGSTILASPWYYWIFVPDCPLAASLMGAALLSVRFGRRWDLLGLLAAGTCIKYGLWTAVSWSIEFSAGGPLTLEGLTMAVTHLLLLVQGVMLSFLLGYRLLAVVLASAYLIANDLADYVAGQYPRLPELVQVGTMMHVAVITTAAIVASWAYLTWAVSRRARAGMRAAYNEGVSTSDSLTKGSGSTCSYYGNGGPY